MLNPIARMIEKVTLIAENPLAAASGEADAGFLSMAEKEGENQDNDDEEEEKDKDGTIHPKDKKSKRSRRSLKSFFKFKKKKKKIQYETHVLENAIVKIGHLLALGFGEAGAQIIAENMKDGEDLDPMMEG